MTSRTNNADFAAFNESGVHLLLAGDNLQATLLAFGNAFALLEQRLSQQKPQVDGCSSTPMSSSNGFWDADMGVPQLSKEQLFVYHKPISISACDHPLFCRAALLFNVSLTNHSLGLQTGDSTTLQNAILLYDLAFQSFKNFLINVPDVANTPMELTTQVYLLAAWNNQATIHMALENREYARDMLKNQKSMIMDLHQRQAVMATVTAQPSKSSQEQQQVANLCQSFLMNEFMVDITAVSACVA